MYFPYLEPRLAESLAFQGWCSKSLSTSYACFGHLMFHNMFAVHFVHSKWKSAVQLSVWPTYFLRTGMAFTLSFAHSIKSTNAPHSRSTKQSHFLTFQVLSPELCPNCQTSLDTKIKSLKHSMTPNIMDFVKHFRSMPTSFGPN